MAVIKTLDQYDIGFTCGTFDILHPEYFKLFDLARKRCKYFYVFLNEGFKKLPIFTAEERAFALFSIDHIYSIDTYFDERQLLQKIKILKNQAERHNHTICRFLGDDYKDKPYTGDFLKIPVVWKPYGNWSRTEVIRRVCSKFSGTQKQDN